MNTVTENLEIVFDGKRYLLEAGDIIVENEDVEGGSFDIGFNEQLLNEVLGVIKKNKSKHDNDLVEVKLILLMKLYHAVKDNIKLAKKFKEAKTARMKKSKPVARKSGISPFADTAEVPGPIPRKTVATMGQK